MLRGKDWHLITDVSGQYRPLLQGPSSHFPFKMGLVNCPETSVTSLDPNPHNILEELRPQIHGDGRLKSPLKNTAFCPHNAFHIVSKQTAVTDLEGIK
jgi:hypothetical protein